MTQVTNEPLIETMVLESEMVVLRHGMGLRQLDLEDLEQKKMALELMEMEAALAMVAVAVALELMEMEAALVMVAVAVVVPSC